MQLWTERFQLNELQKNSIYIVVAISETFGNLSFRVSEITLGFKRISEGI